MLNKTYRSIHSFEHCLRVVQFTSALEIPMNCSQAYNTVLPRNWDADFRDWEIFQVLVAVFFRLKSTGMWPLIEWGVHDVSKRRISINQEDSVVFQKTWVFLNPSVRTSNLLNYPHSVHYPILSVSLRFIWYHILMLVSQIVSSSRVAPTKTVYVGNRFVSSDKDITSKFISKWHKLRILIPVFCE